MLWVALVINIDALVFIDNLHQIFALRCVEWVGLQRRFEMCAKPDICTARLLSVEEELLSEESSPQIRSEEGFVGETWIGLCHPKERKIRFLCYGIFQMIMKSGCLPHLILEHLLK